MTQKQVTADLERSVDSIATEWGVTAKTIEQWTEHIYQAFGYQMPKRGPFYRVDVLLLKLCAMHISKSAPDYQGITGESRRLKAVEFIQKIRLCFETRNLDAFQKFPEFLEILESLSEDGNLNPLGSSRNSQNFQEKSDDDLADDSDTLTAEMSALARVTTAQTSQIRQSFLAAEERAVDELVSLIDTQESRIISKLTTRLQSRHRQSSSLTQVVETIYQLPPVKS